jgi:hypothetical protein
MLPAYNRAVGSALESKPRSASPNLAVSAGFSVVGSLHLPTIFGRVEVSEL